MIFHSDKTTRNKWLFRKKLAVNCLIVTVIVSSLAYFGGTAAMSGFTIGLFAFPCVAILGELICKWF